MTGHTTRGKDTKMQSRKEVLSKKSLIFNAKPEHVKKRPSTGGGGWLAGTNGQGPSGLHWRQLAAIGGHCQNPSNGQNFYIDDHR